jgi:hypothetical protein
LVHFEDYYDTDRVEEGEYKIEANENGPYKIVSVADEELAAHWGIPVLETT